MYLTDAPYQEKWKISELEKMTEELAEKGPEKIVVTGIVQKEFIANFCYEKGKSPKILRCHRVGTQRSGTGDVFSSIIAADAVNQVPLTNRSRKHLTLSRNVS